MIGLCQHNPFHYIDIIRAVDPLETSPCSYLIIPKQVKEYILPIIPKSPNRRL